MNPQTAATVAGVLRRTSEVLREIAEQLEYSDPDSRSINRQLIQCMKSQTSALVYMLEYPNQTPHAAIQRMREAHTALHSCVESLEKRSHPTTVALAVQQSMTKMLECLNSL